MNLEIRRPELVQRVRAEVQNRHLHDALNEKFPEPGNQTGAVALAALQARPYPDVDLTPPRVRLNVRDVSLSWRGCSIPTSSPNGESQSRNQSNRFLPVFNPWEQ